MRRRHPKQPVDAERFTAVMRNLVERRLQEEPEYHDLLPLSQLDPADVERRMQTLTPDERAQLERAFPWLERAVGARLALERAWPLMSHLWDLALWLIVLSVGIEVILLFCAYALPAWQIAQPLLTALIVAISLAVLVACFVVGRAVNKFFRSTTSARHR